jgi:hypothetical protein
MEEDLKKIKMEDDLQEKWKTTSKKMADDLKKMEDEPNWEKTLAKFFLFYLGQSCVQKYLSLNICDFVILRETQDFTNWNAKIA